MAGTKISDLPSAGALTGAELVPVVQSDVTRKTTVADIIATVSAGTVTSVDVSGGTTGLTTSGGPVTTSGVITLAGVLNVLNGGTGANTASSARTNLDVPSRSGSGASGTWGIDISGNAGTVTNGVYTTGSYSNPSWIASLAGSKVTGNISGDAANVTGTVAVGNGGTGQTTYSSGQLLIGNNTGSLSKNTLTAGSNISITNGNGAITIAATGLTSGTVTSVDVSGGSTGLTTSGGPITGSGTITLAGTLDVDNGGTGQTSYSNGQLLIGNNSGGLTKTTLTAGSGISVTNGNGSITIASTGAGSGDVTGPASATDNALTIFDGTSGKIIKQQSDITSDTFTSGLGGPWGRLNIGGTTTYGKLNIVGLLPTSAIGNISAGAAQTCQLDPPGPGYTVTEGYGFYNELNATSGTQIATYGHFKAKENITGIGAGVQYEIGFWAHDSITSGIYGNYGLYSGLSAGATKWNIYAYGTAKNYFGGRVGIGSGNDNPGSELDVKGTIRLSGSTSGYVGLAPAAAAGSTTYTLPSADGTNGQVLKTDGSGTLSWISVGGTGTVTSVDVSGGTTGLTTSGGPITGAGTITLAGTLAVANGGTGATTASTARSNLSAAASGANSDITSMSGITGGISTADYVDFDTVNAQTPAVGRLYWDGGTTLSVGMTANVDGRVNESLYIYIKASAAITKGDVIMQDGAVGASGVLKGKPATTSLTDAQVILGVAAESISLNGFGLIQTHGYLSGLNTTGSAVSETWADGDQLYYNPSVAGGLTKTKPSAPYIKLPIAEVVNAGSGTSGSLIINIGASSTLGGTDSNVQFGTLSNSDVIVYDSTAQYWKNVAQSSLTAGNVSGTVAVANGGTGQTSYTDGQLLIGNSTGNTLTKSTLTAGSGISITNGGGSITIAASGGGATVAGAQAYAWFIS